MADFEKPASETLPTPPISISTTKTNVADASIKNFLQGVKWPPSDKKDRDKLKSAKAAFEAKLKQIRELAAKKAGTAGKTGLEAARQTAAAIQISKVGSSVPDISKFLPSGTNTSNITFDAAINSIQASITKMEELIKNPATAADISSSAVQNASNEVQKLSTAGQLEAAATALAAIQNRIANQKTPNSTNS